MMERRQTIEARKAFNDYSLSFRGLPIIKQQRLQHPFSTMGGKVLME